MISSRFCSLFMATATFKKYDSCALAGGEKKGSLLWVLDRTGTAMGGRMLRSWLERPLLSVAAIRRRH